MYIETKEYTGSEYMYHPDSNLDFFLDGVTYDKVGVIDIEATGLSPAKSNFILGGILTYTKEGCIVTQYFAENLREEKQALYAYLDHISKLDVIITYNGKHYDIKYLKGRMADLQVLTDFVFPYNLDLYLFVNGHSSLRKLLPNLKQKTLENFMGLWSSRTDEISGGESVELYREYLLRPTNELRSTILLHNSDDVLQLSKLLPVMKKLDMEGGFYKQGFPAGGFFVQKIGIDARELKISGYQRKPMAYHAYGLDDSPCIIDLEGFSGEFYISLPLTKRQGLTIVDTRAIDYDFSDLEVYNNYGSGLLAVKTGDEVNKREVIHFVKLLLNRVEELIHQ